MRQDFVPNFISDDIFVQPEKLIKYTLNTKK